MIKKSLPKRLKHYHNIFPVAVMIVSVKLLTAVISLLRYNIHCIHVNYWAEIQPNYDYIRVVLRALPNIFFLILTFILFKFWLYSTLAYYIR